MDGLVRVNLSRTGKPGEFRLGGEGGISALIDTGAQVCLIGCAEGASSTRRSPYRGPLLRGADDTLVECLSTCLFTIRFCGAAMQRAATAERSARPRSAFTVVAAAAGQVPTEATAGDESRLSHRALITSPQVLHSRFGVTDPKVFRALETSATGVRLRGKDCYSRYSSLAYAQQASGRTAIRHASLLHTRPAGGQHASMDFTRTFERDMDGNVCALMFLDVATYMLWLCPLKNKGGAEAARAVNAYREHVRSVFKTELVHLRSDSDPSFAVSGQGDAHIASALRKSLSASPPHVDLTFSPPYCQAMNPIENAVRHAYYLLNFFLAQAHLTMLAWCDMLAAAVHVLNQLPRPQASHVALHTMSSLELATGSKPDLSRHIAAPGQLVVVHHDGAKASSCAQTASLALFVRPSGGGYLVRDVSSWRSVVAYHVRPVHHEVDGIAAQAVAVSHALATGSMREGSGMLSASAQEVASSVRQLQSERSLWAPPPGPIAILDPVTGLAVRLAHVRLDGTLALEEIGSGALAPDGEAAPVAELVDHQ